jgi:hypothetical protein
MFVYELFEEGDKKSLRNSNPCWKGYHPVGTKKKNGKTVPNCVPTNESALQDKQDYDAKNKALQDLSMNKDVDQKAVQQRKLDLEKEAKTKGIK